MTATIETPKKTYTIAEFEALPDDGRRYELVNGELVNTLISKPPNPPTASTT